MLVAYKEQMTAILLPPPLLRMVLKRKLTWKLVLDYLKHFNKFNSSFLRIKFLRKCLDNDIIPNFLRFRVPDNGVFSDQVVHSFQLRLLISELSQANARLYSFKENRHSTKKTFFLNLYRIILPLLVHNVSSV